MAKRIERVFRGQRPRASDQNILGDAVRNLASGGPSRKSTLTGGIGTTDGLSIDAINRTGSQANPHDVVVFHSKPTQTLNRLLSHRIISVKTPTSDGAEPWYVVSRKAADQMPTKVYYSGVVLCKMAREGGDVGTPVFEQLEARSGLSHAVAVATGYGRIMWEDTGGLLSDPHNALVQIPTAGALPAIVGDVSGPGGAVVDDRIVTWNGTSGTDIQDSGKTLTDLEMAFTATIDSSGEDYTDIDDALVDFLAGNYDTGTLVLLNNQTISDAHTIDKPLTIIGSGNPTLTVTAVQTIDNTLLSLMDMALTTTLLDAFSTSVGGVSTVIVDRCTMAEGLLVFNGDDIAEFRRVDFGGDNVDISAGATLTAEMYTCTHELLGRIIRVIGDLTLGVFDDSQVWEVANGGTIRYDASSQVFPLPVATLVRVDNAAEIEVALFTPTEYTPVDDTVLGHLKGIDNHFASLHP